MIGFGLIGCGRIAERHIASLAKLAGGRLSAICDVQDARMAAAEQEYRRLSGSQHRIAAYRDVKPLLQDERVQAVVIATPSAFHAELAKQAIASGKHVILEKPMALSLRDAEHIVREAERRQVVVQVCHQLRYKPVMMQAKRLIEAGAMGRLYLGVVSMRLQRSGAYYEAAPWRGTWDQDGGMLLNQGIHLIDLLQWFMGDGLDVYGSMQRGPIPKQTEDVAAGIVSFRGGAIGIVEANTLTYPGNLDNSITLFGEKGTISIGGIRLNEIRKWAFADAAVPAPEENGDADEHLLMYERFIRAIAGGEATMLIDAAEGKKALELIFALYESVRMGKAVPLPLADFSTEMMADWEEWK